MKAQGQEGGGQTLALGDSKGGLLHAERLKARTWCKDFCLGRTRRWLGGMARGDAGEEQGQTRGLMPMGMRHGLGEYPEGPWLWKWNSGA